MKPEPQVFFYALGRENNKGYVCTIPGYLSIAKKHLFIQLSEAEQNNISLLQY
jgi:hypothetical protein